MINAGLLIRTESQVMMVYKKLAPDGVDGLPLRTSCYTDPQGYPSCIIGKILHELNVPVPNGDLNHVKIGYLIKRGFWFEPRGFGFTNGAIELLTKLQQKNDAQADSGWEWD